MCLTAIKFCVVNNKLVIKSDVTPFYTMIAAQATVFKSSKIQFGDVTHYNFNKLIFFKGNKKG